MAGVAGMTCPECGRQARSEEDLLRTRRRWWWATAGCAVVLTGYLVGSIPGMRERGWPRAVPNAVLIAGLPWLQNPLAAARGTAPTVQQRLYSELVEGRVLEGRLRPWELRWLIRTCVQARPAGAPEHERWVFHEGHIIRNVVAEAERSRVEADRKYVGFSLESPSRVRLHQDDWDLLNRHLTLWSFTTRPRWPSGVPLRVGLNMHWLQTRTRPRLLMVKPDFDGGVGVEQWTRSRVTRVSFGVRTWHDDSVVLGTPPDGMNALNLEAEVREEVGEGQAHQLVWKGPVLLPLQIEGSPGDLIVENEVPELASALQAELRPVLRYYRGEPGTLLVNLGFSTGAPPIGTAAIAGQLSQQSGLALAVQVEVLCGDQTVARTEAWWSGLPIPSPMMYPARAVLEMEILDASALRSPERGAWTMRITGSPEVALRCITCDSCWKGQLTVPMAWSTGTERW